MMQQVRLAIGGILALTGIIPLSALGQTEVGTIVSAVGTVEISRREGAMQPAAPGTAVLLADRLRTGRQSAARVILRDDSVIELADATELVVDRFVTEGDERQRAVRLELIEGKVRVLLGTSPAHTRVEIETSTAIAGARNGAFVVLYDGAAEHTDVVGVDGVVDVQGKLGVLESAVPVEAQQWTRIAKGRLPAAPAPLNSQQFASYVRGLDVTGTGSRESLDMLSPALTGHLFQPTDTPGAVLSQAGGPGPGGSYLHPVAPENFVETHSQDMWATQQPIPEYELAPPDVVPPPP